MVGGRGDEGNADDGDEDEDYDDDCIRGTSIRRSLKMRKKRSR